MMTDYTALDEYLNEPATERDKRELLQSLTELRAAWDAATPRARERVKHELAAFAENVSSPSRLPL